MGEQPPAPAARGATVQLREALDLGPGTEGMAGRRLRVRRVRFEPGAGFHPIHDHRDRPAARPDARESTPTLLASR